MVSSQKYRFPVHLPSVCPRPHVLKNQYHTGLILLYQEVGLRPMTITIPKRALWFLRLLTTLNEGIAVKMDADIVPTDLKKVRRRLQVIN